MGNKLKPTEAFSVKVKLPEVQSWFLTVQSNPQQDSAANCVIFQQDACRQVTGNTCTSDHFNRGNTVCTEEFAFLALQSFSSKGHLTIYRETLYKEENVKFKHILKQLIQYIVIARLSS